MQIVYPGLLKVFLITETENFSSAFFPDNSRGVLPQSSVTLGLVDPLSIFLYYQSNSLGYEGTIGSKSDDFLRCRITKGILVRELSNEGQQIA